MAGQVRGGGKRILSAALLAMTLGGIAPLAASAAQPEGAATAEAEPVVIATGKAQVIATNGEDVVSSSGMKVITPQTLLSASASKPPAKRTMTSKPAVAPPPPPSPPPPAPPTSPPPPPPPPPPPGTPPLFGAAKVGRALFFDTTLSNPAGMACATCHSPQAGWEYPNSTVNQTTGVVPGVIPTRYGNRRPPAVGYTAFLPPGPPTFNPSIFSYQGGLFFDGRAANLSAQAAFPLQNPNEMNDVVHNVASPTLVVQNLQASPNAALFQQVFGSTIFTEPTATVMQDLQNAIAAFEQSVELSPFSARYDAYLEGSLQLSPQALHGLQLFTGTINGRPGGPAAPKNAQCVVCHSIPNTNAGTDIFTIGAFANTGIPRNLASPYYQQTNASADPLGYNPLGAAYIDYGLGDFLYPQQGLPSGNVGSGANGQGDFLNINGVFKIPTLRNVDARPNPNFVKAYGHNGFFKNLKQIVHFYNTRNLTTVPGEVIDFTQPSPYANLKGKPLWPAPENPWPNTLANPTGVIAANGGLVGNLGLTDQDENDIVSFLQTLTDAPPPPPAN